MAFHGLHRNPRARPCGPCQGSAVPGKSQALFPNLPPPSSAGRVVRPRESPANQSPRPCRAIPRTPPTGPVSVPCPSPDGPTPDTLTPAPHPGTSPRPALPWTSVAGSDAKRQPTGSREWPRKGWCGSARSVSVTGRSLGPPLHLGESPGTVVASPWERPLAWPAGRTRRRRRVPG